MNPSQRILVTGATGFVGRHVVQELLVHGYEVYAVSRDQKKAESMPWWEKVRYTVADIHHPDMDLITICGVPDVLIHLAWPGLPHYDSLSHFEDTLPADYRFIKRMVLAGVKQVLITGTCFEYGLQNGCLSEDMPTVPVTPYGFAKDTLRKSLEMLRKVHPFTLQWVRLFYLYGPGQNPKSLLSQLDAAIDQGDPVFRMSGGEQIRDYLPVEEVARRIVQIAGHPDCHGIINCCSGRPVSIRRLVEEHITRRGARIELELGYYPYPEYEPMAFWGDESLTQSIFQYD